MMEPADVLLRIVGACPVSVTYVPATTSNFCSLVSIPGKALHELAMNFYNAVSYKQSLVIFVF